MLPFDENDGGDFDFDEPTQAEQDLAPDSPGEDLGEKYDEPDEGDLAGDIDEVDDDTLSAFVASVVLTNAGVFAVSLGLMLWYFRGMLRVGVGLIVIGLLALIRTYQYYYEWKRSRDENEADEDPDRITAPADDADARDDANSEVDTGESTATVETAGTDDTSDTNETNGADSPQR